MIITKDGVLKNIGCTGVYLYLQAGLLGTDDYCLYLLVNVIQS